MTGPTIALATAYRKTVCGIDATRLDSEDVEMARALRRQLDEQGYEIRAKEAD